MLLLLKGGRKMNYTELYKQANEIIGELTPIDADCGLLCNKSCCKGDKDDGMLIFPHENEILSKSDFLKLKKINFRGLKLFFASCKGACNRHFRPLACRIFPFAPYYKNGKLELIKDPRALYTCPLLFANDDELLSKDFQTAVLKAFQLLIKEPEIEKMLIKYSEMMDDYMRFTKSN